MSCPLLVRDPVPNHRCPTEPPSPPGVSCAPSLGHSFPKQSESSECPVVGGAGSHLCAQCWSPDGSGEGTGCGQVKTGGHVPALWPQQGHVAALTILSPVGTLGGWAVLVGVAGSSEGPTGLTWASTWVWGSLALCPPECGKTGSVLGWSQRSAGVQRVGLAPWRTRMAGRDEPSKQGQPVQTGVTFLPPENRLPQPGAPLRTAGPPAWCSPTRVEN